MNLAYDILHFIQAALPTLVIIAVIALGLYFLSTNDKGKLAISEIALRILGVYSKGVETQVIEKVDTRLDNIEQRLAPPEQLDRAIERQFVRSSQVIALTGERAANRER